MSTYKDKLNEMIEDLQQENKQLKKLHKRLKDTQNLELEVRRENQQFKELLKECVPYVNHRFMETKEILTKPYMASDKVLHKKAEKLLTKINEVLK